MSPWHLKIINIRSFIKHITGMPIMSYDYSVVKSNGYKPMPNSPIYWLNEIYNEINTNIENRYRKKILLGINFYGYHWNGDSNERIKPIINHEIISLLKNDINIGKYKWIWDSNDGEHYLLNKNNDNERIYYPTLKSISDRLLFAQNNGNGIAIWEVGQGLEYFNDLL